jgi:hypothetical protein
MVSVAAWKFILFTMYKAYYDDRIKGDKTDGTYNTHRQYEKSYTILVGNMKEYATSEA